MEFVCVLSVNGSLVSYTIIKETEEAYTASLKSGSIKRKDVPQQIALKKTNGSWQAEPWHDEITPGLTNCIKATADY